MANKKIRDGALLPVLADNHEIEVDNLSNTYYKTTPIQLYNYILSKSKTDSFVTTAGQTSFILSAIPTGQIKFFRNGILAEEGIGKDYTLTGNTITWLNPTGQLSAGEWMYAIYNDLSSPSSLVYSFAGRTGAVSPTLSDYDASQVDNDSGVTGATVKDALNTLQASIPPPAPVSSVFGRTGVVTATLGDYDASQVDNDSLVSGLTVKDALNTLNSSIPATVVTKRDRIIEPNTNNLGHRCRSIAGTGSQIVEVLAPDDMVGAPTGVYLVYSASAGSTGAGKDIDFTLTYGAVSELINLNIASDTTSTYTLAAQDTFAEINLSTLFNGVRAGDICGLLIDHNAIGGANFYYQFRWVYNRI